MIADMRAVQLDLAARATFAADGDTVRETRSLLAQRTDPDETTAVDERLTRSASQLAAANNAGSVEVG